MMKISALLERLEYTCLQGSLEKRNPSGGI